MVLYFDNSATTQIDEQVLETYQQVSLNFFGNPSSLHDLGTKSFALLSKARMQIADLLGVKNSEIIFTSGGTEGNNLVLKGTALARKNKGKHILVSAIEHPSVIQPAMQLKKLGFDVEFIPVTSQGYVDLEKLKKMIRKDTILISVMAVNNEIGTIQPIKEIAKLLEDNKTIYFHVDAVQAIGKIPLKDYLTNRTDFLTFSGHKFHAPRGVGFIYKKHGKELEPLLAGGGQENNLRSGTENVAGITAMSKALRLILSNEVVKRHKLEQLTTELRNFLENFEKVHIYTPKTNIAPHILTFGITGIRGEVLLHALEEKGVYVSTTSACSSNKKIKAGTLEAMKVPVNKSQTVIRISLSGYNNREEIEQFKKIFIDVYQKFANLK